MLDGGPVESGVTMGSLVGAFIGVAFMTSLIMFACMFGKYKYKRAEEACVKEFTE